MPLPPGARLGPYEILNLAGAGGMGEVYRARDTRLDRIVAIKVLPTELSSNADLRTRLEREARAISSLQHPNICALHDIGHQDGIDFLVMEYLEGETLAHRLCAGPLKPPELLAIGIQVADALYVAHRHGVVHRDLKPANIMLTRSGAKLLDFRLAKPPALAVGSGTVQLFSGARTISSPSPLSPVTQTGIVVGTVLYMSPEQIEGKESDARTDIFALGAVLYEMATSKRAFHGKSQISVVSAILDKDPEPPSSIRPALPASLDFVIQTCLAKNPDERFQSAHDLKVQLQWIERSRSQSERAPLLRRTSRYWVALALFAALALLLGYTISSIISSPAPRTPITATIPAPEGAHLASFGDNAGPAELSPDGRFLVVAATDSPTTQQHLWLRHLETGAFQPLNGTEDARFPFWSPDSRWVGFFADGKLKKIDVEGDSPLVLCDAPSARGGSWDRNDTIVFAPDFRSPIFRVPASGGSPQQLFPVDTSKYTSYRWPYFLNSRPKFYGRGNYQEEFEKEFNGPEVFGKKFFGERFSPGDVLSYKPDTAINNRTDLTIGGSKFELIPARGGETHDAMLIYLPEERVMFMGDVIMPYLGAPLIPQAEAARLDLVTDGPGVFLAVLRVLLRK